MRGEDYIPLAMTTIADRIANHERLWVNCGICNHSREIDLAQLAARLGSGHGAMPTTN